MNFITEYSKILWIILLEMSPWLLLGFLFSGILHAFFPTKTTSMHLGKNNFSSVLKAALLGVPLPLCSCGVIPTSVSLYKNGASKSATTSFLISTPQTGVDSIMAIYALLGFPFAIIKPIIAFLSGIFGGFLGTFFYKNEEKNTQNEVNNMVIPRKSFGEKLKLTFRYGYISMVEDLWKWLVIGIWLAALITMLLPNGYFTNNVGNIWLEFVVVLAIAIPMYVCATGSIPIALSLLMKGLSPGAIVLFLIVGPATNIATIAVLQKSLGKKFTIIYLCSIMISGLFFAYIINEFIPRDWLLQSIDFNTKSANHNHHLLGIISSIILIFLIIKAFYKSYFKKNKLNTTSNINMENIIKVEGMTCNHCKMNVEKNLSKIEGVTLVEADLLLKQVKIEGEYDVSIVKNTIEELGYSVKS